ncbi:extracellular solute-binding protein [Halomonas sp. GXIMD04776]|uniref:extracellular solute-binding protein n=1 Tax=Halomonas sp. GXIMD04776 TaxID=3415605 RepID=UPI003C97E6CD
MQAERISSRRGRLCRAAGVFALVVASTVLASVLALIPLALADEESTGASLTVLSWGGAYEHAQQRALFTPFSEATGIAVNVKRYDGSLAALRKAVAEGHVPWDVIDMTRRSALTACNEGLLVRMSHDWLAPAPNGTSPQRDFIEEALGECYVTHSIFATVVAYRIDAFPGQRPIRIKDLFDQERFPGPRALQRTPSANLEWALLSYGVPREELYELLSTPRGLSLALRRLSSLKDLRWWEAGDAPPRMLMDGDVVMASGYNGRFFEAMVTRNASIGILWDGQVQEHETWVIPRGVRHPDAARAFIRFATSAERQAELTRYIPYGPSRQSAVALIRTHYDSGVDMRLYLPTHPLNDENAVTLDERWYASTLRRVTQYFEDALLDDKASESP